MSLRLHLPRISHASLLISGDRTTAQCIWRLADSCGPQWTLTASAFGRWTAVIAGFVPLNMSVRKENFPLCQDRSGLLDIVKLLLMLWSLCVSGCVNGYLLSWAPGNPISDVAVRDLNSPFVVKQSGAEHGRDFYAAWHLNGTRSTSLLRRATRLKFSAAPNLTRTTFLQAHMRGSIWIQRSKQLLCLEWTDCRSSSELIWNALAENLHRSNQPLLERWVKVLHWE